MDSVTSPCPLVRDILHTLNPTQPIWCDVKGPSHCGLRQAVIPIIIMPCNIILFYLFGLCCYFPVTLLKTRWWTDIEEERRPKPPFPTLSPLFGGDGGMEEEDWRNFTMWKGRKEGRKQALKTCIACNLCVWDRTGRKGTYMIHMYSVQEEKKEAKEENCGL